MIEPHEIFNSINCWISESKFRCELSFRIMNFVNRFRWKGLMCGIFIQAPFYSNYQKEEKIWPENAKYPNIGNIMRIVKDTNSLRRKPNNVPHRKRHSHRRNEANRLFTGSPSQMREERNIDPIDALRNRKKTGRGWISRFECHSFTIRDENRQKSRVRT